MRLFSEIIALAGQLFRRRQVERDLRDEMNSYLALSAEAKERDGLDPAEARRAAALELGGAEQVKETVRETRRGYFFETRAQDMRFAFRTLRRSPLFSLTVALVLALGIGSTALMFTIVNSILIAGPPFPQIDRLVVLWGKIPQESEVSFSPREFVGWGKQAHSFESLCAYTGNGFTIYGHGEPEILFGQMVTPSFFATLGVSPAIGRAFQDTDATRGRDHVIILSDALWREKFGGRTDSLGEAVQLNGELYTIVGVMPPGFDFPRPDVKLWAPAALDAPLFQGHQDAHFLRVLGRLKAGVTPAQLQAEMSAIGPRLATPGDDSARRFYAVSLRQQLAGDLRTPLIVLLTAVAFLLVIACANVANLMLARGNARTAELSVRAALGASRGRLAGQLFTEAALLALFGGFGGLGIAFWGLELLKRFAADDIPQLLHAELGPVALGFVFLITALCSAIFGIGPARKAAVEGTALTNATRAVAGPASMRARNLLVFVEVAFAALLLVGCALMLRSFVRLTATDPGFNPSQAVTANAVMTDQEYPKANDLIQFYRESLGKITQLPGVSAAGLVTHLPFAGNDWGNSIEVAGLPAARGDQTARIRGVAPGYFAAMQLPLLNGRRFTEEDNEKSAGVAIVDWHFGQRYWPNENPIGRRVRYDRAWLQVIGVCGDVKHGRLDEAADEGTIYVPYLQLPPEVMELVGRDLHFVARSEKPAAAATELRSVLRSTSPQLAITVTTMPALVHDSLAEPRFRTWLIAIFSGFALTLSALGIYGVIAYLVTQRYREIGIRLALGATRANILRLVLGQTCKLALGGMVAGLVAAFFLTSFLRTILFGIAAHDLTTFVMVPLGLVLVAILAGYLPVRRAMRIDPVRSLRYE